MLAARNDAGSTTGELDRALNRLTPIALAAAGQRLLDRGCFVEWANVGVAGYADVRLLVGRAGSAASVELLGACDSTGLEAHWFAVRIDPDGTRCVWTGPARRAPTEELVTFVDSLLVVDQRTLRNRYIPVG